MCLARGAFESRYSLYEHIRGAKLGHMMCFENVSDERGPFSVICKQVIFKRELQGLQTDHEKGNRIKSGASL